MGGDVSHAETVTLEGCSVADGSMPNKRLDTQLDDSEKETLVLALVDLTDQVIFVVFADPPDLVGSTLHLESTGRRC